MLKRLTLMAAGLCVAVLMTLLLLPMVVNANAYRQPLIDSLRNITGYDVSFRGNLTFRLLPSMKLRAEVITIRNPTFPSNAPLAEADEMIVNINAASLLSSTLEINGLTLLRPLLTLTTTPQGNNWKIIPAPNTETPASSPSFWKKFEQKPQQQNPPGAAKSQPKPGLFEPPPPLIPDAIAMGLLPPLFSIHHVRIENGEIQYTDTVQNHSWEVKRFNTDITAGNFSDPIRIQIESLWNNIPLAMQAELSSVAALVEDRKSNLNITVNSPSFSMRFDGRMVASKINGWLTSDLSYTKDAAQIPAHLTTYMRCINQACAFSSATLVAYNTTFTGGGQFNWQRDIPAFGVEIKTSLLNLDHFPNLPTVPPKELLLNAELKLNAEHVQSPYLAADATELLLNNHDGSVNATIKSHLYGGDGTVSLLINRNGQASGSLAFNNIQMQPFFQTLHGKPDVTGIFSLHSTFESSGNTLDTLLQQLSGAGSFNASSGQIPWIDVPRSFEIQTPTPAPFIFTEAVGNFAIKAGILSNTDLAVRTPTLQMQGAGNINLLDGRIDYTLTPTSTEQKSTEDYKVIARITGSLYDMATAMKLLRAPPSASQPEQEVIVTKGSHKK